MECAHEFEVIEVKDYPKEGFYKTKDGSLSARWKYLKCKKCGEGKTEPIL